jgi:hypothetical protein
MQLASRHKRSIAIFVVVSSAFTLPFHFSSLIHQLLQQSSTAFTNGFEG